MSLYDRIFGVSSKEESIESFDTLLENYKLASGARFKHLEKKLSHKHARNPGALAAWIGRTKFGAKRFAKFSAHGRRKG